MLCLNAVIPLTLVPYAAGQDWTSRAGPTGDFRQVAEVPLTDTFGDEGPQILWRRPLGEGYSGLLLLDHRLVVHYGESGKEVVAALSATDGETQWLRHYSVTPYDDMTDEFGSGPNANPVLHADRVVVCSIDGQLRSIDLASGEVAWTVDLHARYGRQKRKEEYGFSSSPLIVDDAIVIAVGGEKHAVVGLDPKDGSHVWGSAPGRVSYAQASLLDLAGEKHFVYFSPTSVEAIDPRDGRSLWSYPVECRTENNLTPALHLGGRFVWVAGQLDGGTRVLQIPPADAEEKPKVVWEDQRMTQAHWDSFCVGDFVYGSLGGNMSSYIACVEWKTGEVAWKRRGTHLAKGVLAGGRFYFIDESGRFSIARFTPEGLELSASHALLERVCWTPPILVGTKLFARDRQSLVAVELSAAAYVR